MKFYSGFSLKNEKYLFKEYIKDSTYTIAGFSYGAISALHETLKNIKSSKRVDTLQLFSPAFFQTKDKKFKRLQLMSYKKNQDIYLREFMNGCFEPYEKKIVEHRETSIDELKELLEYEWLVDDFKFIENAGVKIEVYLGSKDMIIDVNGARDFFKNLSTLTYIKDANHFLYVKH